MKKLQEIAQSIKSAGERTLDYLLNRTILLPACGVAIAVGVALEGTELVNRVINNKTIDKPGYHLISRAEGIVNHARYIRYVDGSQEVFSLGLKDKFYADTNGDNLVDRIIIGNDVLIREQDYAKHKKEFDEADKELKTLSKQ